ncbi:MAG: DUF5643 domain-containing protein [Peptostreptococcaceae bacterium]
MDKYKVLNNEKIQFDKYTEVKTDNEKMKKIMKSKLKSRKRKNNKLIVAGISATLVLGSVALGNERTLAYINRLVNHIEYFLDRDSGEFDRYRFEGNQSLEQDGLVLNLGDVMLDDRQLIVSLGIDYSNFDLEKNRFNKKQFIPDLPKITIGDMSFPGQGGTTNQRNVRGEDKKEVLYIIGLTSIDTDGDGLADTDFEILDNLEKNKNYDVKIQFKDFDIGESKTEPGRWLSKELGNWEFNTTINSSNISSDVKIVDVNKVIDINDGDTRCKLKIDEVRISPVSLKVKVDIEGEGSDNMYLSTLSVKDENGKYLDGSGTGNSSGSAIYEEYDLKGTEKKIIMTPWVYLDSQGKHVELKDEKIEIDIP